MRGRYEDLTGRTFGRWTVIERQDVPQRRGVYWLCKCECGRLRQVRSDQLKNGRSMSCGCSWQLSKQGDLLTDAQRKAEQRRLRQESEALRQQAEEEIRAHREALRQREEEQAREAKIVARQKQIEQAQATIRASQEAQGPLEREVEFDGRKTTVGKLAERYLVPPAILLKRLELGWSIEEAVLEPVYQGGRYQRSRGV